jgi:hypothetical protein
MFGLRSEVQSHHVPNGSRMILVHHTGVQAAKRRPGGFLLERSKLAQQVSNTPSDPKNDQHFFGGFKGKHLGVTC